MATLTQDVLSDNEAEARIVDKYIADLLGTTKPEVVKPTQLVTVEVQDAQRRTVARTMRRTDELQALMDHYYAVVSPAGEGRFLFDGVRVKGKHTPEDLNMVNGDKIDFFVDLTGG